MNLRVEHRKAVSKMRTALRYFRYEERHPGLSASRAMKWSSENKDRYNAGQRIRYHRDMTAKSGPYFETHYRKQPKRKLWNKAYKENNRAKVAAWGRRRQLQKVNATPLWADEKAILKFYEEARRLTVETGTLHVVDHIVPILSDVVCGLHVESNLQVLTNAINISKKNKFPYEARR